jgi:alkylhydroperoxidase/carboxymuconolactone decarboxylase family protein YurZ
VSFHELATTAAIGVGQRPFRPDELPPALQPLIDPDAEPALQLLDAAAGWEAVRRTQVPSGAGPQDVPEARETRPEPSPSLTALLRRILELPQGDKVLAETCSALDAAGLRLPHRMLVPVLNRAGKDIALLAAVQPVLGARGQWLRQTLPGVTSPPTAPKPSDWDDSIRRRVSWLNRLNRTDPAAAVALLRESWSSEPLDNRVEFLGALEAEPHPAQVDFLEQALLDRSERVAAAARATLAKLPASPWRDRMIGYAAGLKLDDGGLTLTEAPTGKQATRDGATGRDASKTIVAAVPPATWPQLLGISAVALLDRCPDDPASVLALGRAAVTFRDAALAARVLPHLEKIDAPGPARDLLRVVDVPTRLAVAERAVAPKLVLAALLTLPAPWPQQVVDIAVARLDQWRVAKLQQVGRTLTLMEQAISPWLAGAAVRRINPEPRHPRELTREVTRLITVLTLRAAVAEEIRPYLDQENR